MRMPTMRISREQIQPGVSRWTWPIWPASQSELQRHQEFRSRDHRSQWTIPG
jgi:hypothetical protein